MNWEVAGVLAEVVGALAVVVTLGYLAVQIRQNTKAIKATSHHAVTDSFNALNVSVFQDPEVGRLWRLGHSGYSNLTEDEQVSFSFMMLAYIRIFETLYYQRNLGTMEEQLFLAEEKSAEWMIAQPGFREWWSSNPISFSAEFRSYMNDMVRKSHAAA
jgi:hypothetical protein